MYRLLFSSFAHCLFRSSARSTFLPSFLLFILPSLFLSFFFTSLRPPFRPLPVSDSCVWTENHKIGLTRKIATNLITFFLTSSYPPLFIPFLLSCIFHCFPLPSFRPSFLLPSSSFHLAFRPFFPPSFLSFHICNLPISLPSFLPSCLPSFLSSILPLASNSSLASEGTVSPPLLPHLLPPSMTFVNRISIT